MEKARMVIKSVSVSPIWISIICIIAATPVVSGKIVEHTFVVSYIEGSPDGVYKDKIIGINGHFPGPTIEVDIGDILQVDLVNMIQDGQNTTLHWHGLYQKGSPFEDGTSQISQCPLRYGFRQRYKFELKQSGTYWYHSHVRSQYTEGLWGVLIVHNRPSEVYPVDGELVITLNDWYHRTARENEIWHLSVAAGGEPPYPDSGMINGLGRYPCDYAKKQGRVCDPSLQKRAVFNVQRNKTYRVRVINTSAYFCFQFSIEGHSLEAIEADGVDTARPVPCGFVFISPAQRYSFLIRTNNSTSDTGRFLIWADLTDQLFKDETNINQYPEALIPDVTAILQYSDKSNINGSDTNLKVQVDTEQLSYLDKVKPKNVYKHILELEESHLSPFGGEKAPDYFDKEVTLQVEFYEDEDYIRRASFNQTPLKLPDRIPYLMSLLEGEELRQDIIAIEVDHMDVVQIIVNNPFFNPHPFHLHGHHFYVLGRGGWRDGNFSYERHNQSLTLEGVKRDTVLVEEKSWAVLRFVADNVGLWTFHCHNDWHYLTGMGMIWVVGKQKFRERTKITEEARRVCAYQGVDLKNGEKSGATSSSKAVDLFRAFIRSLVAFLVSYSGL